MKNIRLAENKDYLAMLGIYRPYVENTRISFEYETPSQSAFEERMRNISKNHPVLVCEQDGKIIGYAYSCDAFERAAYRWSAELSVYVEKSCRGRGVGKALVKAVEEIVRFLGYRKIYSLVTDENLSSLAFHKAIGYTETARFPEQGFKSGEWVGVIWLEKELNGRQVSDVFPRRICAVERMRIQEIIDKI